MLNISQAECSATVRAVLRSGSPYARFARLDQFTSALCLLPFCDRPQLGALCHVRSYAALTSFDVNEWSETGAFAMRDVLLQRVIKALPGGRTLAVALDRKAIRRTADGLAASMARLHGGDWIAQIDHNVGVILIRPRSYPSAVE
jgi:hypothetical protein